MNSTILCKENKKKKKMSGEIMNLKLYLELLFVGFILMTMLFANNIFLYKQKITDRISAMLIAGMFMSAFEIFWSFCDGDVNMKMMNFSILVQS